MLFFLNSDNKWHRLIRRGLVIGVLTFVAILIKDGLMPIAPGVWTAVLVAALAMIDKFTRTLKEE